MFPRSINALALVQYASALLLSVLWMAPAAALPANTADALLDQLGVSQTTTQPNPRFLPAEQAFAVQLDAYPDRVSVTIDIAPGYYLYRDKLSWRLASGVSPQVTLPPGQPHDDEFFGTTEVYTDQVQFDIPLPPQTAGQQLTLRYQGCTTGMCYPPRETSVTLVGTDHQVERPTTAQSTAEETASKVDPVPAAGSGFLLQATQGGWRNTALFLLLGLGLAFTPCVLPMYPILSAIILGRGGLTTRRAVSLSLAYVQGMALTYTLFGLAVAALGATLQAWMQQPVVLISFSALFLLLALPMFGLFELQLPATLQTRLQSLAGRQQGGSLPGVFMMGALSALVCSPCTTAPLSGALLYVAQSGDWRQGAVLLYALATGMGLPLLLLGSIGNRWLPRRGLWMVRVRQLFGFVLLAAPVVLISRLLPTWLPPLLWGVWLLALLLFIALCCLPTARWRLSMLALAPLLAGIVSWQLWPAQIPSLPFEPITNWSQLQQQLDEAQRLGQPVMVDLYADWCTACHQFERETFSDERVRQSLAGYRLLRADVSAPGEAQQTLLQRLQVPGLPAILFFEGAQTTGRIDGFLPADAFLDALPRCDNRESC